MQRGTWVLTPKTTTHTTCAAAAAQGYKYQIMHPVCGTLSIIVEEITGIHWQDLSHRINTITITVLLLRVVLI